MQGVGLPRKYLGHGICDARSKLLNLRRATADADTLKPHALQLLRESKVPPDKIRGIGLQMTRLCPSTGGSDGVGVGTDGGKAGSSGALHGWLIKPGGDEGGGDSSNNPSSAAAVPAKPAAAPTPRKPTAVVEQQAASLSLRSGAGEDGASSPPVVVTQARRVDFEASSRFVHSAAGEEGVDTDPSKARGSGMVVSRQPQQNAAMASAVAETPASHGPPLQNKRPRGEETGRGGASPRSGEPFPRQSSDTQGISTTGNPASTPVAAFGARSRRADEEGRLGAGEAGALADHRVADSARKHKVARTDHPGEAAAAEATAADILSTPSVGGTATPSRKQTPARGTGREEDPEGAADGQGERPEWLSPPTPAERVVGTPSTGAAGSPSMSQVRDSASALEGQRYVVGALSPSCEGAMRCTASAVYVGLGMGADYQEDSIFVAENVNSFVLAFFRLSKASRLYCVPPMQLWAPQECPCRIVDIALFCDS